MALPVRHTGKSVKQLEETDRHRRVRAVCVMGWGGVGVWGVARWLIKRKCG